MGFHNRSEFFVNVSKLITGTVFAQALPFLLSPILTRLYSPADFAVFGLYFSLITILGSISTGRYELAILLPKKDDHAKLLVHLSLFIGVSVAVVCFISFSFFSDLLVEILNEDKIGPWLIYLPLSIILHSLYLSLNYFNNRNKKYGIISKAKIYKSILLNSLALSLGYFFDDLNGLIIGFIFGQIIEIIILFDSSVIRIDKLIIKKYRNILKILAHRYQDFPLFSSPSALLNSASLQLPVLLLSRFYNSYFTGAYFQAHRVISSPVSIIGGALGQVYFQKATEMRDSLKKLGEFTFSTYKKLFLFAAIPISILLSFGEELFSFVFGKEWSAAGVFAQMISIWILFVFINTPFSTLLSVLEKQKMNLYLNISMFISRFLALSIGYWVFDDVYISILIFGVTGAIIWMIFSLYLLSLVKISYKSQLKFILPAIGIIFIPFILKLMLM